MPTEKENKLPGLDKYILMHCAKQELSLIDLESGSTESPEQNPMRTILRQNVLNQMYFEDLQFSSTIHLMN